MKSIIKIFIVIFTVGLFTTCYDRDIIDEKYVYDFSMPDVENLAYTKNGNTVKLIWEMPETISENFKKPIEIKIRVVEDNIYGEILTVFEGATSTEFTIDPSKKTKVIVKLFGYITAEAQKDTRTDQMYSQGEILEIQ